MMLLTQDYQKKRNNKMAEFGVNATQLSGPSGAGSAPIAPVQEQAVTVDWMGPLTKVGDIFAKGLKNNAKLEADALKNGVVGSYVREQQVLNDGFASGQIKADVVATKSRALYGKYAAGSPQYIEDLFKAKNALSGGSDLGAAEDEVKMEADRQKARETSARSHGAIIAPWMDKATIEQQIVKAEASQAAMDKFEMQRKIRSGQIADNAEERSVNAIQEKKDAFEMLTAVSSAEMTSTGGVIRRISENIRNGSMTPEQGQLELEQSFSGINLALNTAAGTNPELVNHYRSLFDGMRDIGRSALDPKNDMTKMDNELKRLINVEKLSALQDPKLRKMVAANELLGNNAVVALGSLAPITEFIAKASTQNGLTGEFVPQIVGNPDVEKDVVGFLKKALPKLNTGEYKDNVKAEKEAVMLVNNVLKQTGDLMNDPSQKADPKKFVELAKFFSSPEYGDFAKSGKLNPEAAKAAKYTWQSSYLPSVRGSISTKLDEYLYGQAGSKAAPTMVSEAIGITFAGSTVSFVPKEGKKLDPVEAISQRDSLATLKSSEAALNQIIKIGAHLEGTTDYKAYWEDNKHVFMPQLFSKYQGREIGYVDPVTKKVYIGGEWNAATSWK
jgi:hypothetical protein